MVEQRLQKGMNNVTTDEDIAAVCEKPVADVMSILVLRDRISAFKASPKSDVDRSFSDYNPNNKNSFDCAKQATMKISECAPNATVAELCDTGIRRR